jgi:hypothetical protein
MPSAAAQANLSARQAVPGSSAEPEPQKGKREREVPVPTCEVSIVGEEAKRVRWVKASRALSTPATAVKWDFQEVVHSQLHFVMPN